MDSMEWEQQFEATIARERTLMIELLDASRALTGAFRPAGKSSADAADYFAEKFAAWRESADTITRLAENRLAER